MPIWLTNANANSHRNSHRNSHSDAEAHTIAPASPDTGSASRAAFGDSEPFCYCDRECYSKSHANSPRSPASVGWLEITI